MEAVENWMWIIAGILIAILLFTGIYKLVSSYSMSQEVDAAQKNLEILKSSINNVCIGGRGNLDAFSMVFPYVTQKLYVADDKGLEGHGNKICLKYEDRIKSYEDPCYDITVCEISMKTFFNEQEGSIFFLFQRALGIKKPPTMKMTIFKEPPKTVIIEHEKLLTK